MEQLRHFLLCLQELNPLGMSCIQLGLTIDVGQCCGIRTEHKGFGLKVMTPIFQGSINGIDFVVKSGAVEFQTIQLLTKEGQRALGLGESRSNSNSTSITLNFKKEIEVRGSQDKSQTQPILDCLKDPLGGLFLLKTTFLHAFG